MRESESERENESAGDWDEGEIKSKNEGVR